MQLTPDFLSFDFRLTLCILSLVRKWHMLTAMLDI